MKVWKKFSAVALALVMALAMCATALADTVTPTTIPTNNGTVDAAGAFASPDASNVQTKVLQIPKDITAFNQDGVDVAAPTITYKYTITPGSPNKSVADATTDHATGSAVTMTTFAGVTGATMTSTSNAIATDGTTTLAWTTADTLKASATGTAGTAGADANTKYVFIDFTNVAFGATGVYRYKIEETINGSDDYANSGVTDGGNNALYLDVYVKPASTGTFGATAAAADWDIYGYALFAEDNDVTTSTAKLTGFVGGDKYYTYNLTVSKDIDNDAAMEKAAHQFPFSVAFTNNTITKDVLIKEIVTAPATSPTPTEGTLTHTINSSLAASGEGALTIGDNGTNNGSVKYIGIPVGTSVVVTEKNDVTGVTYGAQATNDGTADTATAIATGGTHAAVELAAPTVGTHDSKSHTIVFKNTLLNISPTGVTLRYAPYLAMMGAGVVALPLTLRKKEEEL